MALAVAALAVLQGFAALALIARRARGGGRAAGGRELDRLRASLDEARSRLRFSSLLAELRSELDPDALATRLVEAAVAMEEVDAAALSVPSRPPLVATRGLTPEEEAAVLLEPLPPPAVEVMEIDYRYRPDDGERLEGGLLLPLRPEGARVAGTFAVFSRVRGRKFAPQTTRALAELADAAAAGLGRIDEVAELRESALRDPLTGLFNRSFFQQELACQTARGTRYGRSLTVLALDVDDFAQVNESLGHVEADAVLGEIGARIGGSVRSADVASRVGGDEFAIILEGTKDDAGRLLERIRSAVTGDRTLTGMQMSLSGGIATYDAGEAPERLLRRALDALTRSKRSDENGGTAAADGAADGSGG